MTWAARLCARAQARAQALAAHQVARFPQLDLQPARAAL